MGLCSFCSSDDYRVSYICSDCMDEVENIEKLLVECSNYLDTDYNDQRELYLRVRQALAKAKGK